MSSPRTAIFSAFGAALLFGAGLFLVHGAIFDLSSHATRRLIQGSSMNPPTNFGLFAVTAMLVFYALEDRKPVYILCFAGACVLGSVYGFLQGAWPFGLVEVIWAAVAVRRWQVKVRS